MNTKSSRWLLTLALFATLTSQLTTAHAQGTAFTYQGRLNVGTNAATGIYDLRFGLWDMQATGTGNQQGNLLTNSATVVSNGLFTVQLDFGNQFPGALRWLEIAVRSNGVATFSLLSPRQPLTPAPYAIFANTASNLSGALPAAQLSGTVPSANLPDGLGGSGNTAGGGSATVAGGDNNTAGGGEATVSGGGSNNAGGGDATVSGGTGNAASGNLATVAGGAGNTAGGNFSFAAGHDAQATNNGAFVWADSQGANFYSTNNDSFNVRAQGGARFVTSGAGLSVDGPVTAGVLLASKVGIGTNNPTENLTIANVTNFNSGLKLTGTNTGAIGMALENTSTGGHKFDLITTGTNSAAGAGAFVLFDETLHTNRLTVNSNGFVGINTATPVTPLQVNGTVTATAFAGNGTSVTNVNAATLGGLGSAGFWTTNGNTGANPTNGAFLGTADIYPLEFHVNGQRGLRLEYATNNSDGQSVNVIGGYSGNSVSSGVVGAAIGGGGDAIDGVNKILDDLGTIGGGAGNTVSGVVGTVAGGGDNTASGQDSTVAGGSDNTASDAWATVAGGNSNIASNEGATVPGGENNTASGYDSFAAGTKAQATNDGAFVWADSPFVNFYSTNNDSFNVRARGGARFVTSGAGLSVDGPVAATSFSGNGGGLINVTASQLTSVGNGNSGSSQNFFDGPAGNAATTGSQSTAEGVDALVADTGGGANTAIGFSTLRFNETGGGNTAIGSSSLFYNFSGADNTAVGLGALFNNNGNNNIALGYQAGMNLGTGSNNIEIGNPGLATDNNLIRIGSGQSSTLLTGNVGIGTTTPQTPLDVNSLAYGFPAAQFDVANCGAACGQTDYQEAIRLWNHNGNGQVGLGFLVGAGSFNSNAVPDVWIGTDYAAFGNGNNFKIATRTNSTATNLTDRVYVNGTSGNVGVGTDNPQSTLQVNGQIAASSLRAPGAGINTGTFAFTQRATAANTVNFYTIIDNPVCDNDPNAILIITHNANVDTNGTLNKTPVGVLYDSPNWLIINEDLSNMGLGRAFNVLVIKP